MHPCFRVRPGTWRKQFAKDSDYVEAAPIARLSRVRAYRMSVSRDSVRWMVLLLSVGLSLSACGPDNAPQTTPASPTSTSSPYLGIADMYKAYIPSKGLKVLVIHLTPNVTNQSADTRAETVFKGIQSDLAHSDLDVAVIQVPTLQGVVSSYQAYVFTRAKNGQWGRINDEALLSTIIKAHFK